MGLSSTAIGATTEPIHHVVDARWIMSYAAGLGVEHPAHLDPGHPGGLVAHPMLTAGLEWPAVLAANRVAGRADMPAGELVRGVHATHDVTLDRAIVEGDELTTTAEIAGVERRRPGAYQVLRLTTVDRDGARVAVTHMGSLFLGVDVDGPDQPAQVPPPPRPDAASLARVELPVGPLDAHRYTEGARIWNPIHTDPRAAAAAGLPGTILHGTATLALAVSEAVRALSADPGAVRRICCRFGAMVRIPSAITVDLDRPVECDGTRVAGFRVENETGELAVRDGIIVLAS